jgi:hypothetical protein
VAQRLRSSLALDLERPQLAAPMRRYESGHGDRLAF